MKKYSIIIKSLFVLLVAFGMSLGSAKGQESKIVVFEDLSFSSFFGQSDDGRYGVITQGMSIFDMNGFFYDKLTEELIPLGNCAVNDVSDDGIVVGQFLDKSIKVNGQAVYSGGYWKRGENGEEGKWYSLGLHPNYGADKITSSTGSNGCCITPDGRIVAGYTFTSQRKLQPCTWNIETGEFIEFKTEFSDQNGARPHGLSDDGLSMCGWSYMVGESYIGAWLPCWWKDKNTTVTVPKEILKTGSGFLRAINSVGTKVAGYFGSDGLVIENDGSAKLLSYEKWRGMSDPNKSYAEGIMVGQYATFWTKENGLMSQDVFLREIWGLEYDGIAGIQSISDDGRTISGGCFTPTLQPVSYMITLEGYPLPVAVKTVNTLLTEGTKTVKVTWEKPIYNGYPIKGWNVYRNGEKLNSKLIEGTSEFVDNDAPLGNNGYHVTAEYAFDETIKESAVGHTSYIEVIEEGACFSPKDLVANIVYNKTVNLTWSLPKANYDGDVQLSKAASAVKGYNLYRDGVKLNAELLTQRNYSEEIVVSGDESVEYSYEVEALSENGCVSAKSMVTKVTINPIGTCTSVRNLKVETLRGSAIVTWSAPASPTPGVKAVGYNIYRNGVKLNNSLITDFIYTDSNLEFGEYTYEVDVFFNNSCESPKSAPKTVDLKSFNPTRPAENVGITTSAGNKANLTWDAPELGDYKTLRWFNGAVEGTNGRVEGGELWVACLWDAKDIDNYFDYTVTDVEFYSAYNIPHTFYIYVDGELRSTQVLNSVTPNEFNVAQLDTPVTVERGKTLKVAYKINHSSGNWVIGSDRQKGIDGKGNLMSEDGVNWYNASKDDMAGNWAITVRLAPYSVEAASSSDAECRRQNALGSVVAESIRQNTEGVENIGLEMAPSYKSSSNKSSAFVNKEVTGYNVYRNDVKVNTSILTDTKYSDVMLVDVNNCYEIEALFTNDRKAAKSEAVCSYGECLVPENLRGEIVGEGDSQSFKMSWDVPVQSDKKELVMMHHSGENTQAVGFPQKLKYYALAKWTPFDMTKMGSSVLKAIEVYVYQNAEMSVVAFQDGKLILQQKMNNVTEGEFNKVIIADGGLRFDTNKELMVGVYVNAEANAMNIGMDGGPVVRDRGDLISFDGKGFNSIYQMSGISANWNITAFVEESDSKEHGTRNGGQDSLVELSELDNNIVGDLEVITKSSETRRSSAYSITELLVGYNVYRDGEKINGDYVLTNEYTDEFKGTRHEYQVTAFWNTGCESKFSNKVVNTSTAVDNISNGSLVVYPNPASGVINVVGDYEMVRIYNISGKQVIEVSDSNSSINVSSLNAGVYFVEAVNEVGNIYRTKVIIK